MKKLFSDFVIPFSERYVSPEIIVLWADKNASICQESRYNSVDDTEYFGDGGEDNL